MNGEATFALKLALVGPLPPPEGGMANQTRQLAQLMSAEGVDVRVCRTNEPYRPAWLGSVRGVRGVARYLPYVRSLRRVAQDVEVMHVMANSGLAWSVSAAPAIRTARRRGIPVIVNYRGGLAREFLARSASRVVPLLRRAEALVVPSRFLQDVFAAHGVPAQIIPNIVNLEVFRPREAADPAGGGAHVVITRNLETIYGVDVALRCAALLAPEFPDLRMSIAGAGPQHAQLVRLAAELGVAEVVTFTGRLEVPEVAALYRRADVVLNPSRADNTPNSLLEAAACGVPIVSTDVGGVPFLLEHERTAWLVPPDDPRRMAEAVARVLRDRALAARLRENALQLAFACSWERVRLQWLDLYSRLANHGAPGAAALGEA
jgi:glycosyltransferase involved in cell wall biosynthesis